MKMVFAGIDVGSAENVVAVSHNKKIGKAKAFTNTPEGHLALIKYLNPNKRKVRVCIEATGTYHFDLAVVLSKSKNIEVMVINPRAIKHFAQAFMERNKTDKIDASLLATAVEMLDFQEKFKLWNAPSETVLSFRACARRLTELGKQKARSKNQLHALISTLSTPEFVLGSVQQSIKNLEVQIDELEQYALSLVQQDAKLLKAFELIITIKGIADKSAISILGELLILPEDMTARQWVAHAGLDPRHHTSGKSVEKKARLSKAGNKYLRHALFMPSLSAIRHHRCVKEYFNHLVEDLSKRKMQAICAVMRKLLHAIHGMLKSGTAFDDSRFYAVTK